MRNSICMFSFPFSHIVFLQKMYVLLISLGFCFFAKRVHVLVKVFKDYHSLLSCRDNQGHLLLYFSKTIRVFCLVETINVIRLYFSKTIRVFCLVETIKVICSFTFQRLLQSSLLFIDFNVYLSGLSKSSSLFKGYQSLSSRLQCLIYITRLQGLLFVPDASYILSFYSFTLLRSLPGIVAC